MSGSYEIHIDGRLGPEMAGLLADLDPHPRSRTTTVLTVDSGDQAMLHGILTRLRDLGLTIDGVTRHDEDSTL